MAEQCSQTLTHEWQKVCSSLEKEQGNKLALRLLKRVAVKGMEANEVCLSVPTTCIHEFIKQNYADQLLNLWKQENPLVEGLKFKLASQMQPVFDIPKEQDVFPLEVKEDPVLVEPKPSKPLLKALNALQKSKPIIVEQPVKPIVNELNLSIDGETVPCILNPANTFDTFVVGKSNEFAYAAARKVAEDESVSFNPLYIHAPAGLGKTHLMHAIAWRMKELYPEKTVLYLSSEQFFQHFVKALRYNNTESFHNLFRNVDVLMVDDIQFIFGKKATQEEFFHTFNALVSRGKKVILSADTNPLDLQGIEDRLKTRIAQGLVVNIQPTSFELRLGILNEKIKTIKTSVPSDVLEFLSKNITASVRELEGALKRVVARAELIGTPINVETTREILRDILQIYEKQITITDILEVTADYYGLKISDLKSVRRERRIARPRQMAMYLSKLLTSLSLPDIGLHFERDHTTILHAIRTIEDLVSKDEQLQDDLDRLRVHLKEGNNG